MSTATIEISYGGPALSEGTMDVRELAPALLAIGDVVTEANRALNEDRSAVKVSVKSDFKTGSFEIGLEVIQTLADQVRFFTSKPAFTAENIAEFIGLSAGSGISLFALIKWLRGRKISSVTTIKNGKIRIETDGNYDSIEVSEETVKLYRHKKTRQGIKEIVKPLLKKGIDKFIVREREKKVIEIAESEEPYFDVPEIPDEEITDSTRRVACNIIGVFFEEGLKWRLYDGENKLNAIIKDSGFLVALDKGEVSFTKGDMLIVKLRTRQWQTEKGLKQEHEVVKVIKQQKAKEQIPLPFKSEDIPGSDT